MNFIRYRLKAAKVNLELLSEDGIKLIELDSKSNRRVIMNPAGNGTDLAVIRLEKLIPDEQARTMYDQARDIGRKTGFQ